MIGKRIRIERILNRKTGRCVIVPMDHGVSVGPVAGITIWPKQLTKLQVAVQTQL